MSLATATTQEYVLNAGHRCDACGSRAYVYADLSISERLPNGGALLFCTHHFRQHVKALAPYLAAVIDETSQIREHIKDDKHVV